MYWFRTRIRRRDHLMFFPSFAHRRPESQDWNVNVRGWVYVPRERVLVRRALIRLLRRGLQLTHQEIQSTLLKERLRAFLVNNKRHKCVSIRIGQTVHALSTSRPNGHIEHSLVVPAADLRVPEKNEAGTGNWQTYEAVLDHDDKRMFRGQFELIEPTGVSIITDIDDTIKLTNVANRRELLLNTFLREFRPVPGMSKVFGHWAAKGASFHYVSSSPWQLFEPLQALIELDQFPRGSFHLREFRLKERSTLEHLSGSETEKRAVIEKILNAFPQRRFIYFGDSGERDPEMYGQLARSFPRQLLRIFIRNASGELATSERFRQAFREVPNERWRLFGDAEELLSDEAIDIAME